MRFADEMLDHLLGDLEVGDDARPQRPDGLNILGRLAHHQLGVVTDRLDLLDTVDGFDGNNRRFVEDDAAAANVDEGVGGSEVDRHVVRHPFEPTIPEHSIPVSRLNPGTRRNCRPRLNSRLNTFH